MKKSKNLGNVFYDIDGMLLDDLIKWAEKQKEFHPEYDSFKLEFEKEYHYDGEYTALNLYGLREETKEEEKSREAIRIKKLDDAKAKRKKEWDRLNKEFGE